MENTKPDLTRISRMIDSDIYGPENIEATVSFGFDGNQERGYVSFSGGGCQNHLHVVTASFAEFCEAFLKAYKEKRDGDHELDHFHHEANSVDYPQGWGRDADLERASRIASGDDENRGR